MGLIKLKSCHVTARDINMYVMSENMRENGFQVSIESKLKKLNVANSLKLCRI